MKITYDPQADAAYIRLKEAGLNPTPKLDHEIAEARRRFKKSHTISWNSLKNELKKNHH